MTGPRPNSQGVRPLTHQARLITIQTQARPHVSNQRSRND
jgi:hypothetical protein